MERWCLRATDRKTVRESRAKTCQARTRIPGRTGIGLEADTNRTLLVGYWDGIGMGSDQEEGPFPGGN